MSSYLTYSTNIANLVKT